MNLNLDKSTWKRVAFGDVVKNVNVSVKDPAAVGIDRVIAMEHLDPGELKISRWSSIEDGTTFTRRVRPGQTLFGKRRAYQRKAAYAEFDAICSGDILAFEADPELMSAEFLPFLVQNNGFYDHALGTSAGSLSPRTNWRDLAKYEFDLPPLDEQQRIADLLWSIELHRTGLAQRDAATRAASTRLLDAVLTRVGETRVLSQAVDAIVDCPHQTAPTDDEDFARVIGTPDIRDGRLLVETARSVSQETYRRWTERAVPRAGDLIFTREAPAGEVAIVPAGARVCLGQRTVLVRPKSGDDSLLILAILRSNLIQERIRAKAAGSTVPHLNVAEIRDLEVPWPGTREVRHRVSTIVETSQSAEALAQGELKALDTARAPVMSWVFGGAE